MSRGQASSGGSGSVDEAASPARARLATSSSSSMAEGGALLVQPTPAVWGIPRTQTASAAAAGGPGGETGGAVVASFEKPGGQLGFRGASELSEAGIREEPAAGSGSGSTAEGPPAFGSAKAVLPALPQSPGGRIKAGRPATASPGRGVGSSGGSMARRGSLAP